MICTPHPILNNVMGGTCSVYGGEKRRIEVFGGKPDGKGPCDRFRRRWKDNIKMGLQELGWVVWIVSSWLRIRTVVDTIMNLRVP
jgi:hypothetical protein